MQCTEVVARTASRMMGIASGSELRLCNAPTARTTTCGTAGLSEAPHGSRGQHGSIPWRCRSTAGHTTEAARQPLEAARRYSCRGQTGNGDRGSAQPTHHERGCALLLHNIRSVAHHMRWPGGRAGTRHRCHAAIVNNGCEHMGIGTQPRRTHLQRSIGRRQEAHQRLHTPQVQELKPSQTTAARRDEVSPPGAPRCSGTPWQARAPTLSTFASSKHRLRITLDDSVAQLGQGILH